MARPKKYPDELIQRGIRLALESERPIAHIAADLGMHPETLRKKVRQFEADTGKRPDLLASQEREEIRGLRKENYELRRANGKVRFGVFCRGARPGPTEVSRYVDEHRGRFGVEPICKTLGVSADRLLQAQDRATVPSGGRGRAAGGPDPRAARQELLRLWLPADVEGAPKGRRSGCRAARCSG